MIPGNRIPPDALAAAPPQVDAAQLAAWLNRHRRVVVISGAGLSTASGIPDYRDDAGEWKHRQPMTYQTFTRNDVQRRRYWARSFAGWHFFTERKPNAAHVALQRLEATGRIAGIITQNVDRLHERAGSRHVIDLHGRLDVVLCLSCHAHYARDWLQAELRRRNPGWSDHAERITPDGDADIAAADFSRFQVPDCPRCGGMLKPDVVFYGESVPRERRARVTELADRADALLVVGSSLMVWSSFRLVRAAAARGVPIVAINRGRTRGDALFEGKNTDACSVTLTRVADRLVPATAGFTTASPDS